MYAASCKDVESTVINACNVLGNFRDEDDLQQIVDETVDNLVHLARHLTAVHHIVQGASELLEVCSSERIIDPDDELTSTIEQVEEAIERTIAMMVRKRSSALKDDKLNGHNEMRVTEAYSHAIKAYEALHDAAVRLRWAIMEHDADLSPVSDAYENVEDLIASLKA